MEPDQIDLISRGQAAQRLLEEPLLLEALDTIEKSAVDRLKACDVSDTARLQTLVMSLQAASGFRGMLSGVLHSGKMASEQREQEGVLQSLRTRFVRALA